MKLCYPRLDSIEVVFDLHLAHDISGVWSVCDDCLVMCCYLLVVIFEMGNSPRLYVKIFACVLG